MSGPPPVVQPSPIGHERRWWPALGLVALMFGLPVSGLVATAATSSVPTQPLLVAEGVEITPPDSWEFEQRTGAGGEVVVLSNGTASLAVVVEPSADSPVDVLADYMAGMREDATQFTEGDPTPFEFDDQTRGIRASYGGVVEGLGYPIEGEVTVIPLGGGGTVLFDGWAEEGTYGAQREAIDDIIRTSRLGS